MKKLYTFLFAVCASIIIAQPTGSLVTANYYGGGTKTIFTDLNNQTLYYYTSFPFELKRIENNNTETTLLSRNVTGGFAKAPRFNNNKGIFVVPTSTSTTKVYLFNNTIVDSIELNQDLMFTIVNTKDYIIGSGSNPSYFWIQNQFYKTNLTGAGTTTISLVSGSLTYSITAAKETNNKLLIAANASNGMKYVFYHDGMIATKIDSLPITINASTRYEAFKNPANNDVFMIAVPGFHTDSIYSKIWKLTSAGTPTVLTTLQKISRPYTTLNNKLIAQVYTTASNKFVTVDLNTGNLQPIVDNSGLNLSASQTEYFQSNGTVAYFAGYNSVILPGGNVPCFTNGLTLDTVTTRAPALLTSNMNGSFCGNDYWVKNQDLKTLILTTSKTYTVIPQTNTSTQTSAPLAAYSNIYYFKDNVSGDYDLYKSSCANQVGINELISSNEHFYIYPNPTIGIINVEIEILNEPTILTITNILGEIVFTEAITTKSSQLNIENLISGIYFLQTGSNKAVKFIKE